MFFIQGLFFGLPHSFGFPTGCRRSFGDKSIRFSTRSSAFCFDLLITSSLIMSTWYIFGAHVLRYLVVLMYPMNIPFQVLYTLDLERFFNGIYVLTLLPNIKICSRFYLTPIQAFFGMMIVLSAIRLVGNRFCR